MSPGDVSGQPRIGEDESFGGGGGAHVASNVGRSDQQLHRGEIKVAEACGVQHLVLQLTEASGAANLPPPPDGLQAVEVLLALNPQEEPYLLSRGVL